MANTYLSRTSGTPTNALKWTFSTWIKLGEVINGDRWLLDFNTDSNNRSQIGFAHDYSKPQLIVYEKVSNSTSQLFFTAQTFRDPSAWTHILVSCDRTLGTDTERTKIYINGERVTAFHSTPTYPTQNTNGIINTAVSTLIGKYSQSTVYYNGSMTHTHFIDGTAYDADDFGETDSTSGIWKPKTSPSVTYGTNGFFLKFENSGAMGTDSSGNSNTFTVSGTLTQNVDTPSNNFATFNPLKDGRMNGSTQYKATFTNGNTTSTFAESTYNTGAFSSLAVNSGKYYAEIKCSNAGGNTKLGLFSADDYGSDDFSGTYLYDSSGTFGGSAYGNSFTTADIIQIAFDATNGTVWFGKNGTWQDSATQSEIEAGTTTNSATTGIDMTQFWHLGTYGVNATAFQANFGQGYFGTTAVSSAGTSPSEGGIFEYDCPSGFQALCTKGINSF